MIKNTWTVQIVLDELQKETKLNKLGREFRSGRRSGKGMDLIKAQQETFKDQKLEEVL